MQTQMGARTDVDEPMGASGYPITVGTSILGMIYKGGVMLAADTKGSYGGLARFCNVPRIHRINNKTLIAYSGDIGDFQFLKKTIDEMVLEEDLLNDGFELNAPSLHSWLTRVLYNKRSRFEPLWNSYLVAGTDATGKKPFLGFVNMLGVSYEYPRAATGMGMYFANPIMEEVLARHENDASQISRQECEETLRLCMRTLYKRDARSSNRFQLAHVEVAGGAQSDKVSADIHPIERVALDWTGAVLVRGYE